MSRYLSKYIGEVSNFVKSKYDFISVQSETDESVNAIFFYISNVVNWQNLHSFMCCNNTNFIPVLHNFDSSNCGIGKDNDLPDSPTEIDWFKLFFDSDLVYHIVEET